MTSGELQCRLNNEPGHVSGQERSRVKTKMPQVIGPRALVAALERDPSIRLLDVRTTAEFQRSHLRGSCNVPLGQLAAYAEEVRQVLDPIVLVCRSGARARVAEEQLRRAGMRNLHLLEGGMLAWRGERLPVESRPLSVARLVGRGVGIAGVILGLLYARTNPLLAIMLAFLGLRMALGQPVLPCAAAGTCAVAGADTGAQVRALIAGVATDSAEHAPESVPL